MHYYKIRQQCLGQCDNEYVKTLSWMISRKYKKDKTAAKGYAVKALAASDDPVEYLKQLDADIRTGTRRVAVIKGDR